MIDLRVATVQDAPALREIYAPYVEGSPATFDLEVPPEAFFAAKLTKLLPQLPVLVAVEDGQVVGYCYASPHHERPAYRWTVEVSVYLAPSHHRRGIGRQLYQWLFDCLRQQGYRTALAGITIPNPASVGLHEAFGFTRVALLPKVGFKMEAWRDVGWWALDLSPAMGPPVEPTPFSELSR